MKLALDEWWLVQDIDKALGIIDIQIQVGRELRPKSIVEDDKDVKEGMVLQYKEL